MSNHWLHLCNYVVSESYESWWCSSQTWCYLTINRINPKSGRQHGKRQVKLSFQDSYERPYESKNQSSLGHQCLCPMQPLAAGLTVVHICWVNHKGHVSVYLNSGQSKLYSSCESIQVFTTVITLPFKKSRLLLSLTPTDWPISLENLWAW